MKKQKYVCATCGKVFYKYPTDRRCKTTYCSRACYIPALAERNREQNSNKQNNSPENLIVFASQSDHAKWHIEHKKEVMPK